MHGGPPPWSLDDLDLDLSKAGVRSQFELRALICFAYFMVYERFFSFSFINITLCCYPHICNPLYYAIPCLVFGLILTNVYVYCTCHSR